MKRKETAALRKFGLQLVGDVPWGTHLCQFYETKEDLIDILVPYFAKGLRNNEFCMWVTSPPLEVEEAKEALRKAVPELDQYVQKGQIEILPYTDWYLLGGTFDSARVLQGWVEKEKAALERGLDGLRLTGNTIWLEKNIWKAFTDYEEEVNNTIGKYRMIAICTYSLDRCNANEIIDVIKNHQFALVKRSGKWELIESSESKKVQSALMKSEMKFSALYSSMIEGAAFHDIVYDDSGKAVDYIITDVNPSYEKITGLPKKQAVGKRASELYGTGGPPYLDVYAKVASSGKPAYFETYFPPMNKHFSISVFSPSKGKFTTVFHDITEHKKVEEALRESEIDLNRAQAVAKAGSWRLDVQSTELRWSDETYRMFGIPRGTPLTYETFLGTVHPEDREHVDQKWNAALRGEHYDIEHRIIVNGEVKWVREKAEMEFDKSGALTGGFGTVQEITERKQMQSKLEDYAKNLEKLVEERTNKLGLSELYARSLIEASLDPLVTINVEGKITDVNKATELATGCSRKELIGSDFSEYFTEPEKAKMGYKKAFEEGFVRDYPLVIRHKSGKTIDVSYNASIYRNAQGEPQGIFAAARDITALKKAEEKAQESAKKLKDAERLAAIGATAGMVGHDIRNPLQSILGDVYLAKIDLASFPDSEEKESLQESLEAIGKQTEYINKIVLDLQDFAKPLNPHAEETDLERLTAELLLRDGVPENIQTEAKVDIDVKKVIVDSAYMKRILGNLISNAVQAMPNGGKLAISAYREAGDFVITVKDTGVGISDEAKSKLFQPLFTTKSKGQGFGLAVVKRLTEALNGIISFESQEGKGTQFTLRFPSTPKNN